VPDQLEATEDVAQDEPRKPHRLRRALAITLALVLLLVVGGAAAYVLFLNHTVSKNVKHYTRLPVSPYIGVAYGTFEDRARLIGGLNIAFDERWGSTILFDGVRIHPLLNYTRGRHQFGVIFERGRNPGASYSISF